MVGHFPHRKRQSEKRCGLRCTAEPGRLEEDGSQFVPALTKTDRIRRIGLGVGLIYPAQSCMSLLMLCYYVLTSLIVGSTEFLEQLAKLNGEGANHLTCLGPHDPKSKKENISSV